MCTHEEASAAIAHGYAKVAGKPMACLVHSTVGLQHASMAIYNAWCDRVPVMVLAGNIADAAKRRPGVEWYHTAQDLGALVRDYTKYDDYPVSLQHYAESFMRAQAMSVTPPMAPVLIVADAELQEQPIGHPHGAARQQIVGFDPVRELGEIRFREQDAASLLHARHGGGVRVRHAAREDRRAALRLHAGRVDRILGRERHAVQRPQRVAAHHGRLGLARGVERAVRHRDDRIDRRIDGFDAIQVRLHHFHGRYRLGADQFRERGCILIKDFGLHGLPFK